MALKIVIGLVIVALLAYEVVSLVLTIKHRKDDKKKSASDTVEDKSNNMEEK